MKNKIGFGTMGVSKENMEGVLIEAINQKYDFIDTAFVYGNEEIIGDAITSIKNKGIKLIPMQSKIYPSQFSKGVREEFFVALKKLNINKIDSYMLHRPHWDMNENIKAWSELIKLKKEGYINIIGVSNYDREMLEILKKETGIMPSFNQIEISVNNLREDRINYCLKNDIDIQGWSVMGDISNNLKNKLINDIAKEYGCEPSQILVAYVNNLGATPIVKSNNVDRVIMNKDALKLKLTASQMEQLKSLNTFTLKFSETFDY